jgi:BolA protein
MTTRAQRIEDILTASFPPETFELRDESARHAGHAGRMGLPADAETHFHVTLVSDAFAGVSRVERSRRVHDLLAAEFSTGLHALSLTLRTTAEARNIAA